MKKFLSILVFLCLFVSPSTAQEPIYFPLILKGGTDVAIPDPILRISAYLDDELISVDLLGPHSGWKLEDPYWRPNIATTKGGGDYVASSLAPGRRLVNAEDGNVIESIPLSVRGRNQDAALQTLRELLQLLRQARDYWTEPWEYENVWIEARPACNDCFTGYARISQASVPDIGNVFGQPFFSALNDDAILDGIILTLEREPYWRALPPGEIVGPLYNYLKNPDCELWNFGVADSQPDSWLDLESVGVTGTNNRQTTGVKYGQAALRVEVRQSTAANQVKGVTQVAASTRDNTVHTMLAWIRSDGVSEGVGRLLVTSNVGTYEVYRRATSHGWLLFTQVFTSGVDDEIGVHAEILTTGANCDGTVYFDGLMLVEGDWQQEAVDGVLPWMSSSHVVNHWDQATGVVEAGDINWVDAWNVPGDVPALVRLEIENNTEPADFANPVERFATIRVGQRRTNNAFNFENFHDPPGAADTTASSDDRLSVTPSTDWLDVVTNLIVNNLSDNQGRFRVLARVRDVKASGDPTLEARLSYFAGVSGVNEKTLDAVQIPVRDEWTIVNLTPNAAVSWDFKFLPVVPGQLGYTVQFRRTAGTDTARFDYSMIMPTDGGYTIFEIDPSLPWGSTLISDATSSVQVSAVNTRLLWSILGQVDTDHRTMKPFLGDLYLGCSDDLLYRVRTGSVELVQDFGTGADIETLEVFNGLLYLGRAQFMHATEDGVSFTQVQDFGINTSIESMLPLGGLLYIGVRNIGAGQIEVHTYDGSAVNLIWSDATESFIPTLESYGGRLYVGTGDNGRVFEYDPDTGAWQSWQLVAAANRRVTALEVFDNQLYASVSDTAVIRGWLFKYDGSAWEEVWAETGEFNPAMLRTWQDAIYFSGTSGGLRTPKLLFSTDGETFDTLSEAIFDPRAIDPGIEWAEPFLGALYVGTSLIGADPSDLYTLTPEYTVYENVSFEGTSGFTAPNRRALGASDRRHRWVFSYDRGDFVNDIDDAALIGLGFVPRYLTLRGRD